MNIDWQAIAVQVTAFLAVSTVAVPIIRKAALRAQVYAARTAPKWDDTAVKYVIMFLDYFGGFVELLTDLVPVISIGKHTRPGGGSGAAALLFALGLTATASVQGCAGTAQSPADARVARADLILGGVESGLLQAGEALVPFYQAAEARCRPSAEEADYQRCIYHWDVAIDALSSAYYTVRVARDGLGASDGADKIPCIASAVENAVSAVEALDLDLPPIVETGLNAAKGLAGALGGECSVQP